MTPSHGHFIQMNTMHALCSANVLNTHWKVGPALLTLYFRKPWFRESKQFGQCDTVRIEGTSLYIYVMVSQRCSYSWYAILPLQARCLHIWTVYILTIILFSVWKKIWSQKSCFWNRDVISWVKACCSFSSIPHRRISLTEPHSPVTSELITLNIRVALSLAIWWKSTR